MHVTAQIDGLAITVSELDNFGLEVREAAYKGVMKVLDIAFTACARMLSESDHSLWALAQAGHPYSAAHGFPIHSPDELIHVQSGAYRAALRRDNPAGSGGNIIGGAIYIDEALANLDRMLQEGTSVLRRRPWMQYVVTHFGEDWIDLIEAYISAAVTAERSRANTITNSPAVAAESPAAAA